MGPFFLEFFTSGYSLLGAYFQFWFIFILFFSFYHLGIYSFLLGHLILRSELKSLDPFLMLDDFSGMCDSNRKFYL
jgi:hypothetical protein